MKTESKQSHEYAGQILVVDDDHVMREFIQEELRGVGYEVSSVGSVPDMWEKLGTRSFDVLLIDLFLDGEDDTLSLLPALVREFPYTKFIVMSAHGTIDILADAIELGATTFVNKSEDPKELITNLKDRLSAHIVPDECSEAPDGECLGIVGESDSLKEMLSKIYQIRDVSSSVLITGESGTGKELAARAVHKLSQRKDKRFDAINCGAIPENLLESELFGHKRGAFTDAKTDRKGMFELCSDGTLFLDEIGELPLNLQVKLLRVLQEQEVMPLGSSEVVKVNTRILAATNKDLAAEVRKGTFREDLFYRLAVLHIHIEPLRERRDDIPCLIEFFLKNMNQRFGKKVRTPSPDLMIRLVAYEWPGNIRELKNAVERGAILARDNEMSYEDMIETSLRPKSEGEESVKPDYWSKPLSEAKQVFERAYLKHLLDITRGNISEIARISGRYRTDVYRLLSKHGVDWEEFRPR